ncbi:uncharacterized protein LOC119198974 [Pungitius pungitius]|uniref:uncharacterized protein LOC119198974 n=1 Tax=Pungitius pungitius TaxID=134920 RepID=UPI002E134202
MRRFKRGNYCFFRLEHQLDPPIDSTEQHPQYRQRLLISTDEMNVLLVITVMFALLHLGKNQSCTTKSGQDEYKDFVKKHFVQKKFDRKSRVQWKKYIEDKGLCHREEQSFLEQEDQKNVEAICGVKGHQVQDIYQPKQKNLCISTGKMIMYHLKVENKCEVTVCRREKTPVVVACNKVANKCLPVHFQEFAKQKAGTTSCNGG